MPETLPLSLESRVRLRQNLAISFNIQELKTLCYDLGVDYENIFADATKDESTREMVLYFERNTRIDDLIEACARRQPRVR